MYARALELLERDTLLYADMINLLAHREERPDVRLFRADERGVLLSMEDGYICMTALFERDGAEELLLSLGEPKLITTHQEWSEPIAEKLFGPISENTRCRQLVYTGSERLPEADLGLEIIPMPEELLPLAAEHYHMGSLDYLAGRREKGELYGGLVDGELAGFIGFHSETSMGMLEVLPQYRRRGYARALESRMVNIQLERGYIPYGQVVLGNEPSMALQRSLGFKQADGVVSWLSTRFAGE